ncbi:hypothetical protein MUK42_12201 [Musa troglodytarum]|uniref:Uncharacterized protein n=1 Tax=Musa troglodytarum TaxID=320322 RepID=A0A9E7HJE9_9LILI|nr:hypothetical protein MUK42_12201 [Musa troglodytarum]
MQEMHLRLEGASNKICPGLNSKAPSKSPYKFVQEQALLSKACVVLNQQVKEINLWKGGGLHSFKYLIMLSEDSSFYLAEYIKAAKVIPYLKLQLNITDVLLILILGGKQSIYKSYPSLWLLYISVQSPAFGYLKKEKDQRTYLWFLSSSIFHSAATEREALDYLLTSRNFWDSLSRSAMTRACRLSERASSLARRSSSRSLHRFSISILSSCKLSITLRHSSSLARLSTSLASAASAHRASISNCRRMNSLRASFTSSSRFFFLVTFLRFLLSSAFPSSSSSSSSSSASSSHSLTRTCTAFPFSFSNTISLSILSENILLISS